VSLTPSFLLHPQKEDGMLRDPLVGRLDEGFLMEVDGVAIKN
jgi:hypothetical protein